MEENTDYGLDMHCQMILDEYRENLPVMKKLQTIVMDKVRDCLVNANFVVSSFESRIKTEASLAGKLALKGAKYGSLSDITDILGARVITFYIEDVDKIASIIEGVFEIDWANSVDKRKMHNLNSFGYNSLHYICRIPEKLFYDESMPMLNEIKFEVQMRTVLQHMWASMEHDIGYKSEIEIPREYIRNINRLAGMMELADDEFSRIRSSITDYRRRMQALVADGKLDQVTLSLDTYNNYLNLRPFDKLNEKIAATNQAEIHQDSFIPYLEVFKKLGFKTLGDIDKIIKDYSEDAFKLAVLQIGGTDLDIISSTVAPQDLCIVYVLSKGEGIYGLKNLFDIIYGKSDYNNSRAQRIYDQASQLEFMHGK